MATRLKLKLDEEAMQESFFEETCLLGIGSTLPPYRLCWMLNRHFDIDLVCDPDLMLSSTTKDLTCQYMVYEYKLPNSYNRYLLYQLKNNNVSLLPEIKNIDYLWMVQTADSEEDARNISEQLRTIADIQFSRIIDRAQLKNARSLIV